MRDAWRLWRRDWEVLTGVAGFFIFLPTLAANLLAAKIPAPPENAKIGDLAIMSLQQSAADGATGWLLLLASAFGLFGQFAIVALYLGGDQLAVRTALGKAARRFPLLLLAGMIIGIPFGAILVLGILLPPLMIAVFTLIFWLLARTVALAPALLAEAPIGALGAIRRSLELTRGNTLALAASVMTILLTTSLLGRPFDMLDTWMLAHAPNPIARALVDGVPALFTTLGSIAMALVQVAAYRRLRTR
jgi:hypothetical protein